MKSIQKHIEDNTYNTTRHGNKIKPSPIVTPIKMPETLPKEAAHIWRTEAKEVQEMRILSEKDIQALADLVRVIYRRECCEKDVKIYGYLIKTNSGAMQRNPALTTIEKCDTLIHAMRKEFGLTPLSAQRMATPPEDETPNEWDDLY